MEGMDSSICLPHPNLPPGFRFHPTDEELVVHYLKKKVASAPLPVTIIAEIDLYKFDPWELPSKTTFGEQEWYFFSPRDRKYPNGARPNRSATSGYWKATGIDKPILSSNGAQNVGVKKALVFYCGKPRKGIKTNWIMHEYRLVDNSSNAKPPAFNSATKKGSLRLDDWVLCRIYKKNNTSRPKDDIKEETIASKGGNFSSLIENEQENFFEKMLISGDGMECSAIISSSKSDISMVANPGKRSFPSPHWNHDSQEKKFHSNDHNNASAGTVDGNGSFISLLNPIPQSATFHPNTVLLGSLADCGLHQPNYQLSAMNWPNS